MDTIVEKIHRYQRNIANCGDNEDRLLYCVSKLYNLPVTVQHLQETGVGRTVNNLRKYDGCVGDAAKALVAKWKVMVVDEESSEDEDEIYAPDSSGSPKPNIEENDMSDQQDLEHKYKENDNEPHSTTGYNMKNLSKSKSDEKYKSHEKSKHSSKHHSHNERKFKESKSSKHNLNKDETHSSKKHNHCKNDNMENVNDKINENDEKNSKKKMLDSSFLQNKNKKIKTSDSKNYNERPHSSTTEKNHSHKTHSKNHSCSISSEIMEEIKTIDSESSLSSDKDKQNSKQEKRYSQEKSRNESNNMKPNETAKAKDSNEKQKHKKEEHASHKKNNTRENSNHHSNKETSDSKNHSSSNDKNHISKSKVKKEHKDKKSKDKHEEKKETKTRVTSEINSHEGIDCNSGTSFAEALGMCTIAQSSKKRSNNSPNVNSNKFIKTERTSPSINNQKIPTTKKESEDTEKQNPPSLLGSNIKLEPLNVDLASTLPEISPNYKPLQYTNYQRKEEIKAPTEMFYIKNQRTKVYSGNKVGYTTVPTLYDMCIWVLIENIDALEFTGGVPYDILKPILEHATADQLFMLEHYNPYLIEDTDALWQFHCNREFRSKQRQELESWREMYMRCLDEREAKLKNITANIKQSIGNSVPTRSTKLAYVDNVVKPPRNILKKQAKYGTANDVSVSASSLKRKLTNSSRNAVNSDINIAVPSRIKTTSGTIKKNKAPLMAKALQLIKTRYKIR